MVSLSDSGQIYFDTDKDNLLNESKECIRLDPMIIDSIIVKG